MLVDSFKIMWGDTLVYKYDLFRKGYKMEIRKNGDFLAEYGQAQGSCEWVSLKNQQKEICKQFPETVFVEGGIR